MTETYTHIRAEMVSEYIRLAMRVADCKRCGIPDYDIEGMIDGLKRRWADMSQDERWVIKDCGA